MLRRLPLLEPRERTSESAPLYASYDASRPRLRLPVRTLACADTGDGLAALQFAVDLLEAFAALGARLRLVVCDFDRTPRVPTAIAARLSALTLRADCCAVEANASALPAAGVEGELAELWVGLPAVSVLWPDLAIALGADRPILSWPPPLRARRSSFQLELGAPRTGLAEALASALTEHGFLPRG